MSFGLPPPPKDADGPLLLTIGLAVLLSRESDEDWPGALRAPAICRPDCCPSPPTPLDVVEIPAPGAIWLVALSIKPRPPPPPPKISLSNCAIWRASP